MSERTTIYTPDSGNSGGMLGILAPLLQQRGLDPNMLLALQNKGNGGFGNGDGSWLLFIIFLFFLFGWGNNGWGNNGNNGGGNGANGIPNLINNDNGRELLMQAITGNGNAISQLATNLNCSIGQVQQAINGVMSSVQQVGNQVGQSSMQIINSITQGNCQIAQAIADCCCKTQNAITTQGYENQLAMCNQTNSLQNTMNQNTLSLRDVANANNQAILAKLDQMTTQNLMDKLDAERQKSAALAGQLSQEHQTAQLLAGQAQTVAPLNNAIADISARLAKIECGLPPTVPVVYPNIQGFNADLYKAAAYGAYAGDFAAARATNCGC